MAILKNAPETGMGKAFALAVEAEKAKKTAAKKMMAVAPAPAESRGDAAVNPPQSAGPTQSVLDQAQANARALATAETEASEALQRLATVADEAMVANATKYMERAVESVRKDGLDALERALAGISRAESFELSRAWPGFIDETYKLVDEIKQVGDYVTDFAAAATHAENRLASLCGWVCRLRPASKSWPKVYRQAMNLAADLSCLRASQTARIFFKEQSSTRSERPKPEQRGSEQSALPPRPHCGRSSGMAFSAPQGKKGRRGPGRHS